MEIVAVETQRKLEESDRVRRERVDQMQRKIMQVIPGLVPGLVPDLVPGLVPTLPARRAPPQRANQN